MVQKASDQLLKLGFVLAPVFVVMSTMIVIADSLYQYLDKGFIQREDLFLPYKRA